MRKKILICVVLVVGILCVMLAFYAFSVYTKSNFSTKNGKDVSIYISNSTTMDEVLSFIAANTEQKYAGSFERIARYKGLTDEMRLGHYIVEDGMSNRMLYNRLTGGMGSPVKLKFNNVRLVSELILRLDKQLMLDSTELANLLYNEEYLKTLGYNSQTIISMFIPNTYEVYWNISAEDLLSKMKFEHDKFWESKGRIEKARTLGMSPLDVSVLASIVDSETNSYNEKPIVAGLYLNRLNRGIPLQADPTVKFAVGDFGLTQILYKHLAIESPYNTYKNVGLPPGPISMASIQGIDAVLNATDHNYIYMCANPSLDGTHSFASSLSQHNVNAARYHEALRAWKRKNK